MPDIGHLSELLEWSALVAETPAVIYTKTKAYMATLAYCGEDLGMMEEETKTVYLYRLNTVLARLGTGWAVWADLWHEPTTTYPQTTWANPTAALVDAARRALYDSGQLMESQQFLTLSWQPPHSLKTRWYDRFFQSTPDAEGEHDLDTFLHAITRWADGLTGILPEWHWLTPEEMLTYLHRCVTWDRHTVRMPEIPIHIAERLASEDFLPGHTPQLGQVVPGSDPARLTHYLRPIEIQQWPKGDPANGGGLGFEVPTALQGLPFPYRFCVRYIPLDKTDGESELREEQSRWENLQPEKWPWYTQKVFPIEAAEHAASMEEAVLALRTQGYQYGYTTPVVLVWGETEEELRYREREATKVLQASGLIVAKDLVNSSQAWLGMQPGDRLHNCRAPLLPSLVTAFLMPHATIWTGDAQDKHLGGPPLIMASSDGTPMRVVLHPGDSELGNTMVLGPSRTGKSGLLGLMMAQFLRYPKAQVFCFDKDYSAYVCTLLHDGVHYDLGKDGGLGLHPLGQIDKSEAEKRWAAHWLTQLLTSQGVLVSAEDREQVWIALGRLEGFPPPMRTLSGFGECLQDLRLKHALSPFVQGGAYAFLDADHDEVALHPWTTFEMRGLLEMPEVLPHVLRYRFHRMAERFDGRPTLIVIDESRKLLADPVFGPEILDFLKERAKVNVSVVLCTQEIADAASTPAWQAIQASCKTWVYLPNEAAVKPSVKAFYQECGLSDAHIQMLALSVPKQDYLYKTDRHIRRFQLTLTPLERALVAASTPEEIADMRLLRQEALKEPLVSAWLRRRGMREEADIFRDYYHKGATDAPSVDSACGDPC